MKVLMLNPPFFPRFSREQRSPAVTKSGTLYYPMWLAYATGVLESNGYLTALLDAPAEELEARQVLDLVCKFKPRLVVMTTSTPSIYSDLALVTSIKDKLPETFLSVVGPHVSALPEEALTLCPKLDAVAIGEYDYTILDLANHLRDDVEHYYIPGLASRMDEEIRINDRRDLIMDLDSIPFVSKTYARHLKIDNYFYAITRHPEIAIVSGRGCPHHCNYCVYPQTMHGRLYRFRSPENLVEELKFIKATFPQIKEVFFEDDTLTVDKKRCQQICELMLNEKLKITWTANSRADVDLETLKLMKEAGCRLLCVGVESGDQEILNNINKGLQLERIEQFFDDARKAGIMIHGCFMAGNRGETRQTLRKTLNFALRLKPDTAQFFPLMVYPGTRAYKWAQENGFIGTKDFSKWVTEDGLHNCVIETPELSARQLVRFCDHARRRFYLRPGYMLHKGLQSLRSKDELARNIRSAKRLFKHLLGIGGAG